jgi:hypothetical protein
VSAFSPSRRKAVVERAGNRCEYCRLPTAGQVATFPIDHILPKSHGGSTDPDNLALTCPHCNAHKWTAFQGIDPSTGDVVPLFDPRREDWPSHFRWSDGGPLRLQGLTPTGRTTIAKLRINDDDMVQVRELLFELGIFEG